MGSFRNQHIFLGHSYVRLLTENKSIHPLQGFVQRIVGKESGKICNLRRIPFDFQLILLYLYRKTKL